MKTIDITPTWRGILPVIVAALQSPEIPYEVERDLLDELTRMARAADNWNEHVANLNAQADALLGTEDRS
jgi:hypothetical protein